MKKNTKINAFTLAEILLTLIILGTVSALTVPSLKNHSDEAKYVAATQKAMSEVTAAVSNIESIHGDASTWNFSSETTLNWFKQTLNTVPIPSGNESWERTNFDGTSSSFTPTVFTADGMAWEINNGGYPCGGGCALIDVNGPEQPNTIGVDIHGFRIGHLCSGTENKTKTGDFGVYAMGDGLNDKNSIWACTAYVIKHKKMPWLYQSETSCATYMGK